MTDSKHNGKFVDPSDFLKGEDRRHVIEFYHIPTNTAVEFKAWLTDFSDRFESEWSSEQTYGRMDPIQTFKQTTRTIDIAWEVLAASAEEAARNMADCQKLFRMLYPTYGGRTSNSLQASPLMKLKFVNLIQSVSNAPSRGKSASAKEAGLTGTMSGFSYSPDLDSGFFDVGAGTVFPQTIKLECTFTALHTHDLGYDDQGKWRGKDADGFPYTSKRQADSGNQEASDSTSTTSESSSLGPAVPNTAVTTIPTTTPAKKANADAEDLTTPAAYSKKVRGLGP